MNVQNSNERDAALTADEASLKATLRLLIDEIHGSQHHHANRDIARINQVENEIRRAVLQIVQIERERIEIRISNAP